METVHNVLSPARAHQLCVGAARHADGLLHARLEDPLFCSIVQVKDAADYAMKADLEVEEAVRAFLHDAAPEVPFHGEESGNGCGSANGSGHRWVVDPIDGTGNLKHGSPQFGSIFAYVVDGEPVAAAVSCPFLSVPFQLRCSGRPEGILLSGHKGGQLLRDGKPFSPPLLEANRKEGLRGGIADRSKAPAREESAEIRRAVEKAMLVNGTVLGGCASINCVNILTGLTHWYGNIGTGEHYDVVAFKLLLELGGGLVRRVDGSEPDWTLRHEPLLFAANQGVLDLLLEAIGPKLAARTIDALS